jgi:hypothetical protein
MDGLHGNRPKETKERKRKDRKCDSEVKEGGWNEREGRNVGQKRMENRDKEECKYRLKAGRMKGKKEWFSLWLM